MTTPDFRALCAELTEKLQEHTCLYEGYESELITRARAALAEPEQVGPSDHELTMVYAYAVAAAVDNKRGPFKKEDAGAVQLAGLRAVLARWGR
jgi:hypothetical protein